MFFPITHVGGQIVCGKFPPPQAFFHFPKKRTPREKVDHAGLGRDPRRFCRLCRIEVGLRVFYSSVLGGAVVVRMICKTRSGAFWRGWIFPEGSRRVFLYLGGFMYVW